MISVDRDGPTLCLQIVHKVDLCQKWVNNFVVYFAETFKVDINNTVELLKGEIGSQIRDRNIVVSFSTRRSYQVVKLLIINFLRV